MGIETLAASSLFQLGTTISTAASVIGGVAGFAQGQAEARRLRDQADAEQAAAAARAERLDRQNRLTMGSNRARLAASGLTLDGSPLDALVDEAGEAELNELLTRYEGDARAHALREQADAARAGGFLSLGGSLLAAGGSYLGGQSYYQRIFGGGGDSLGSGAFTFASQNDAFDQFAFGFGMGGL